MKVAGGSRIGFHYFALGVERMGLEPRIQEVKLCYCGVHRLARLHIDINAYAFCQFVERCRQVDLLPHSLIEGGEGQADGGLLLFDRHLFAFALEITASHLAPIQIELLVVVMVLAELIEGLGRHLAYLSQHQQLVHAVQHIVAVGGHLYHHSVVDASCKHIHNERLLLGVHMCLWLFKKHAVVEALTVLKHQQEGHEFFDG